MNRTESGLPLVTFPGKDPFVLIKDRGNLPSSGIILYTEVEHGGKDINFSIYDYDKGSLNFAQVVRERGVDFFEVSFDIFDEPVSKSREIRLRYVDRTSPSYQDRLISYQRWVPEVPLQDGSLLIIPRVVNYRRGIVIFRDFLNRPWYETITGGRSLDVVRWFAQESSLTKGIMGLFQRFTGITPESLNQVRAELDRLLSSRLSVE